MNVTYGLLNGYEVYSSTRGKHIIPSKSRISNWQELAQCIEEKEDQKN